VSERNIKPYAFKNFLNRPTAYVQKAAERGLYAMQVPEETYVLIEEEIHQILAKKQYGYLRWGVVLCLLHIPHKFKNRYFCSQFVAEVLLQASAVELKKKESLYLPGQLIEGLECLFSTKQIIYDAI